MCVKKDIRIRQKTDYRQGTPCNGRSLISKRAPKAFDRVDSRKAHKNPTKSPVVVVLAPPDGPRPAVIVISVLRRIVRAGCFRQSRYVVFVFFFKEKANAVKNWFCPRELYVTI